MQLGKDVGLVLESLVEPVEELRLQSEIALVALELGDLFGERRLRHTIIIIRMADINFIVLWWWCVGREVMMGIDKSGELYLFEGMGQFL